MLLDDLFILLIFAATFIILLLAATGIVHIARTLYEMWKETRRQPKC